MDSIYRCLCLSQCCCGSSYRGSYRTCDDENAIQQRRTVCQQGANQTTPAKTATKKASTVPTIEMQHENPNENKNSDHLGEILERKNSDQTNNSNRRSHLRQCDESATNSSTTMHSNDNNSTNNNNACNEPILSSLTLDGIAELFNANRLSKSSVIVLVGAGMSTAAGIPDFRSPSSGIYHNLQKYNLPHPEDVFKISYFKNNPAPFYDLSKSLLPDKLYPTLSHYFVRLLHETGYLLRCYSQNVDGLEAISGIPKEKLVLAHGSFETGRCLRCNAVYKLDWMRKIVEEGGIPHCVSTQDCKGLVKPDVKFFGERLDGRFFRLVKEDFPKCELLIVIGSSLTVMPFAQLVQKVPPRCPRLLINKTKTGHDIPMLFRLFWPSSGLRFDKRGNTRDVAHLGNCDEACLKFATLLGWQDELKELAEKRRQELELEEQQSSD